MKIAALKMTDPWASRVAADAQIESDALDAVPVETFVEMELVELLHGEVGENYRPYLHLRGELVEVKPSVDLPYGVTELSMTRGGGTTIDVFYDFNQDQLASLVSKGYFSSAFTVPTEMTAITWPLPAKADFLIVPPADFDQPPLVFMTVRDQSEMALTESTSGHELSQYFADVSSEVDAQREAAEPVDIVPQRGAESLDVFSDVVFEEHRAFDDLGEGRSLDHDSARATVPDGIFSRLISEIEGQEEPAVEQVEDEPAPSHSSAWDIYLSRVAPGVDHVLSGEHLADQDLTASASELVQGDDAAQDSSGDQAYGEHPGDGSAAFVDDTAQTETFDSAASFSESVPLTSDGFIDYTLSDPSPELQPLITPLELASEHERAEEKRIARVRAELATTSDVDAGDDSHRSL